MEVAARFIKQIMLRATIGRLDMDVSVLLPLIPLRCGHHDVACFVQILDVWFSLRLFEERIAVLHPWHHRLRRLIQCLEVGVLVLEENISNRPLSGPASLILPTSWLGLLRWLPVRHTLRVRLDQQRQLVLVFVLERKLFLLQQI